jgi:predicted RNase H-like nuclease (RuvC/YqgF family)
LEDEIEILLNQLDAGDDSVSDLWRSKRRELSQLKQSSDGLTHPCYQQLFENAEQFNNVQNAQNTAQVLSRRLALFAQINQDLAVQINHAIQDLQQEIKKLQLNQPEDTLVKQLEREVETLRDNYTQQQAKQKQIQQTTV